jgi:DNA-directed RNA polymerase subunit RPC12/RpoP
MLFFSFRGKCHLIQKLEAYRDINFKRDDKGTYIECPKCTSKHTVLMWQGLKGSGGRWRIGGLRT